ncbi:M4 family metallopeptidase [Paucisalibacillus sp. EB02]|uniref:M4 family metallopeptidase n=1 Tax=Paucisalibacillus sp. EB02 TaxID=1347087 RepID=UPI0005AA8EDF|nr:M4 family metallopeptidase [Paucisalibacillus sp. EB02]
MLKKKKGFKKKALPVLLTASLAFSGFTLSSTNVFASGEVGLEKDFKKPSYVNVLSDAPEGLSKEDTVYLFLQSQVSDRTTRSFNSKDINTYIKEAKKQFEIVDKNSDKETGTHHFRTVEMLNGIPIYGSEQTVALDKNNDITTYFGKVTPNLSRSTMSSAPALSEDEALDVAKNDIEKDIGEVEDYDGIDAKLIWYPENEGHTLAYLVKASTSTPAPGYFHYFVDANSGDIMKSYDAFHEMSPVIDSQKNSFSVASSGEESEGSPKEEPAPSESVTSRGMDIFGNFLTFNSTLNTETGERYLFDSTRADGIHTFHAERMPEFYFLLINAFLGFTGFEVTTPTSFFYDPAAVSAHVNAGKVYDYYQEVFDRDSLDNEGMKIISTVHVGEQYNNAGWNGKQMIYGDGDGQLMISTSGSMDVIGHEMTHGVIEHTANLIYEGESGALNESLADIMGAFIEDKSGDDLWLLGEDIYTPNIPGDGLRDMKDPGSVPLSGYTETGFYPDHYDDRYLGEKDNGGVHINSSINNKAAHLITEGGTHYGVTVNGIGKQKAEKIFYRTLTHYLTASSNFSEMRQAAVQAARDLYPDRNGEPSAEVQTVMAAYDAVGVQ